MGRWESSMAYLIEHSKTLKAHMSYTCALLLFLSLPFVAHANDPCGGLANDTAIVKCTSEQVTAAEKELDHYLSESKSRIKREAGASQALLKLENAQAAWFGFRKEQCESIYEFWSAGSNRTWKQENCMLHMTRARTHEIWNAYLTYPDSTKPLLPEPNMN